MRMISRRYPGAKSNHGKETAGHGWTGISPPWRPNAQRVLGEGDPAQRQARDVDQPPRLDQPVRCWTGRCSPGGRTRAERVLVAAGVKRLGGFSSKSAATSYAT
jgi:hypothetical protein